jgi:hypothetical protein
MYLRTPKIAGAMFAGLFSILLFIAFSALFIYMFILFVKLAHRGIRALDIYIRKNSFNDYNPQSFNSRPYSQPDNRDNPGDKPQE